MAMVMLHPSWCAVWGRIDRDRFALLGSSSLQPVWSPQGRFLVVGDIWFSDRASLLPEIAITKNKSDSEILAYLWEKEGENCLTKLEGIFSFIIWEKERDRLWLVRDASGGRTLYYTQQNSTYYIAPRLATLQPWHSQTLNLVALRDYLSTAFVPGEQTLWQDVRELSPGTILLLPESERKSYFDLKENISSASREDRARELRSLLNQIVPEYLPVNESVGVYLSGGLDSSCIAALAAQYCDRQVFTYSIHFGADCQNELEFSSLVANHCQTEHRILEITPQQMWEKLPIAMANLDDPIGDPLTVPNYLLGQLAREDVRVILNGEGGDPCFGGPKNQPMLLNRLYNSTQTDLLSAYLNSYQKCAEHLPQLLKPDIFQAVVNKPSVFTTYLASDAAYLNRLMTLNIRFKGADHILTKVNNLTRSALLEGRSPLFDRRIIEFSLCIPPEYKLAGAVEKAILKEAVKDLLPPAIVQRPKSGMMVPVQRWFYQHWQRSAKKLLLDRRAAIAPYLNQKLMREWLNYRGDIWQRYGVKLWLLVSLEYWLREQQKP
ncbi:asparagine synthetase B family protein [Spirulina sp. 06S082]|uniref:asparagine synthetase B family protein n=1 Tax=Spirulina sp. 06S082 TaxID=3110248 RepID=UPI002B1F6BD5|nr:asparagine synthase-related protein [Spirulina sp. 06S082]MEA5467717.1 asparagine synthase-related protein [Spirulina sp. 06S082]